MFDLHNHILPGLDDGPHTMEESLVMAQMAARDGIKVIVVTPHLKDVRERNAYEELSAKLDQLQALVQSEGLDLQFRMGMETLIDPELPVHLKEGLAYTLGGSRYVLVELPVVLYPPFADDALFQIQLAGYIPVIAHPERHAPMQKNPDLLATLVDRGMLTQVTAGSFLGSFGADAKRAAEVFLRRNLVHVIASDAHASRGHRTPVLSRAVTAVAKLAGQEKARRMVYGLPAALLAGQEPIVEHPTAPERKRLFGLW